MYVSCMYPSYYILFFENKVKKKIQDAETGLRPVGGKEIIKRRAYFRCLKDGIKMHDYNHE